MSMHGGLQRAVKAPRVSPRDGSDATSVVKEEKGNVDIICGY